jgi:hypothetical protein
MCLLDSCPISADRLAPATVEQLRKIAARYPKSDRCDIQEAKPLSVNHPDRFAGATEYTHTVEVGYSKDWGFVAGITTDGDVHVWMD